MAQLLTAAAIILLFAVLLRNLAKEPTDGAPRARGGADARAVEPPPSPEGQAR
jgi:hypothetical protein